jgi:drug/metabolite transporter (DMT)-like permease
MILEITLTIFLYIVMGIGTILIKKSVNQYEEDKKVLRSKSFIIGIFLVTSSIILVKIVLIFIDLSTQYPLSITSNLVIVLLGVFYLKEHINAKRLIAIIISLLGVFLLVL